MTWVTVSSKLTNFDWNIKMRNLILLITLSGLLSFAITSKAQDGTITLLTTYNETGFSSRTSAIMKPKLETYLKKSIEIQYRSPTQLAVDSPGDGSVLFVSTIGNMALLPSISKSFDVDPLRDLRPVTRLTYAPDVLIVHAGLGINTLDELITYSHEHPGTLDYSHIAPRSIHRVEFAALLDELGIDATLNQSTRGATGAMDGVADGTIDLVITTSPYVTPLIDNGSVIPLAVAHPTRMPLYPNVPTLIERGITSIPHGSWAGLFVPASTSDNNVAQIFAAVKNAMDEPVVKAQINALGMEISLNETPAEFVTDIEAEMDRLKQAAERYGITLD
jgi:tripartite-type tricarboxylate transporter receptor subunit TctC